MFGIIEFLAAVGCGIAFGGLVCSLGTNWLSEENCEECWVEL